MKKFFIVAALCAASFTVANAQLFIAGSFNINTTGGSYKSDGGDKIDSKSTSSFTLTPRVGYFLNDKFAVGLGIGYTSQKETTPFFLNDDERKETTSMFVIAPFARYYFAKVNRFSFFGEGVLSLGFGSYENKVGNVINVDNSVTAIGFDITPGISYALTDKLELETSINLFNLGYSYASVKDNKDNKTVTNGFNFGVGTDNIVTLGAITVGAIYRF
jgi:opacity protein-like surface antigen